MEGLLAPARYIRRSTGVKVIKVIKDMIHPSLRKFLSKILPSVNYATEYRNFLIKIRKFSQ